MSTVVDKKERRPRRSAAATREHVIQVARGVFSRSGYDAVGVREIAAEAEVDPAIVMRLFGSKEALFADVAAAAFDDQPVLLKGDPATLGERLARLLMGSPGDPAETDEFDDLQLLLRSASSAGAAPILAAALHRKLVEPLAARIGAPDASLRAALLTSQILGFATLRFALGSPAVEAADPAQVIRRLGASLQRCVDTD